MSYYEEIYEVAADNYGFITSKEARDLGVPNVDLVKMAGRGRLDHLGYGVYRLSKYFPTAYDKYAEAIAFVGSDAYLYGESVLAMHNLALVNPMHITVATSKRIRRTLPSFIKLVSAGSDTEATIYEGIPSQSVADALRTCRRSIMPERLLDAAEDARKQGLISEDESKTIKKEIRGGRQKA